MSEEKEVSALVQLITPIIAPLPEDARELLMDLIKYELETKPIIAFAMDRPRTVYEKLPIKETQPDGREVEVERWIPVEKLNVWTLGGKSPIDPDATVFAMLLTKDKNFLHVWSFTTVEVNGQEGLRYWREVVDYHLVQGPSSAKAMVLDFEDLIAEDDPGDEPTGEEKPKTNGAGAPARA